MSLAGFDETGGLYAARDLGILDEVLNHATQGLGNQFVFEVWNNHPQRCASLALKDGWDLSIQLYKAKSLAEAVKAYDVISVPRANKVLSESHQRIAAGH